MGDRGSFTEPNGALMFDQRRFITSQSARKAIESSSGRRIAYTVDHQNHFRYFRVLDRHWPSREVQENGTLEEPCRQSSRDLAKCCHRRCHRISWPLLLVRQSLILGLAVLAIATIEQPLTVAFARTAGNTDPHLDVARPETFGDPLALGIVDLPGPQVDELTNNLDRSTLLTLKKDPKIALKLDNVSDEEKVRRWLSEKIESAGWILVNEAEA